ncbi:MAG: pentapeptide repeat-containing protein [Myxococcales bacterium]|nr:MAG: pentapeptide repeat-containing protein [Myxococcales bacterium]
MERISEELGISEAISEALSETEEQSAEAVTNIPPKAKPSPPPLQQVVEETLEVIDEVESLEPTSMTEQQHANESPTGLRQPRVRAGDEIAGLTLTERMGNRTPNPVWSVWKAQDRKKLEAVAYIVHPGASDDEKEKFITGTKIMAKLTKAGPVRGVLRCYGMSKERDALITEYLSVGRTTDIFALGWPTDRILLFMQRLCNAMDGIHQFGYVHGCLRPGNILLDDDLNPVVTEIGFINPKVSLKNDIDATHGYGPYTAPEVLAGHPPTTKSDIFSLGKLLLFMLTGEHPRQEVDPVPSLKSYANQPEGLIRIARRCTLMNPDGRYATVKALAQDLSQWTRSDTVGMALRTAQKEHAPESKELHPVQEISDSEVPEPAFGMQNKTRIVIGSLGVVGLLASAMLAYSLSAIATVLPIVLVMASGFAGIATLSLPASPKYRHFSFIVISAAAASIVYMSGLIPFAATLGARERLHASGLEARTQAVRFLVTQGFRDFTNIDLRDADLSNADLNFAKLRNADLTGANLRNAMVQSIDLQLATLKGRSHRRPNHD